MDVEAEVGVLESDLKALELGRPALVYIPALDARFRPSVDVISPSIDAASRTCQVLMRLQSEDGRIKPGMFVRASIAGEIHPGPAAGAARGDPDPRRPAAALPVEDERAKWVYVRAGPAQRPRGGDRAASCRADRSRPGTLVVVDNHLTLTHDAKVKVDEDARRPWADSPGHHLDPRRDRN